MLQNYFAVIGSLILVLSADMNEYGRTRLERALPEPSLEEYIKGDRSGSSNAQTFKYRALLLQGAASMKFDVIYGYPLHTS
jgi:hypothetical protein